MANNHGRYLVPAAIILGFVILTSGIIWGINKFSFRVALVDLNRVTTESGLSKRLNQEIKEKGEELQAKASKSKTDAEKKQIDLEFETFKTQKSNEFSEKVKDTIKKIAQKKGIKAVTRPEVYIFTDEDITTQVINELK